MCLLVTRQLIVSLRVHHVVSMEIHTFLVDRKLPERAALSALLPVAAGSCCQATFLLLGPGGADRGAWLLIGGAIGLLWI